MRATRGPQTEFDFDEDRPRRLRRKRRAWDGREPRTRVPHRTREALASRFPVHVSKRLLDGLPNLRNPLARVVLHGAFASGGDRFGFRLIEFSIQGNHLHLVCEAADRRALARGMQGLCVRIAKRLNKFWGRSGTVFADRYHAHILRTAKEVRNALAYILHNTRKHGGRVAGVDDYSSGPWFDGWRERVAKAPVARFLIQARTWLLRQGWRRHGLVGVLEAPW